jgi:site-specific DNA-methyltransferase (adenine-specific)
MEHLIRLVTPNDGKIIDFMMGSGTSGVAAVNLGNVNFVGIEISNEYYHLARKRMEHAVKDSENNNPL